MRFRGQVVIDAKFATHLMIYGEKTMWSNKIDCSNNNTECITLKD